MNRRSPVLVALVAGVALAGGPVRAADFAGQPAPSAAAEQSDFDSRLLIAGLGAIAGAVAFNLAVGGTGALPFLYEAGAASTGGAVTTTASGAVAASRVYAVSSAVGGALVASYAFRGRPAQETPPVLSRSLAEKVSPR